MMHSNIKNSAGVPMCSCGGQIKPDVVLYEEGLDSSTMQAAIHAISQAEVLIIGGTSLAVYPAAGLIDYYRGNKLVLINKSETQWTACRSGDPGTDRRGFFGSMLKSDGETAFDLK